MAGWLTTRGRRAHRSRASRAARHRPRPVAPARTDRWLAWLDGAVVAAADDPRELVRLLADRDLSAAVIVRPLGVAAR